MKAGILLLSVYPLSGEYVNTLREKLGREFEQTTLADIRQHGGLRLVQTLIRLRPNKLLLPLEDENSGALLPILKLLAGFTRAKNIALVSPDLKFETVSRFKIILDILKFGFASLSCFFVAMLSWLELKRVLKKNRIILRLPEVKGSVLYLKTNLWFGIKAGGSVGHIAGVVNALQEKGLPVTFASAEKPVMVDPDVDVRKIRPPRTFGLPYELNNYRFQRSFLSQSIDILNERKYSFIYQRLSAANYLGVLLSRAFRIPLVVEYNGSEVWIAKHWGRPMRFHTLAAMAEKAMLRHAHLVVTISDVLKDELISKGVEADRIVCYPNCIDPHVFSPDRFPESERNGLRQRYDIPADANVVAFIGTFGQWHGAEVLARAIAYLWVNDREWVEHYRVHFLLVGDGLKMPQIRDTIKSAAAEACCTLTGLVPQDQAPLHLAAADLLVSPHVPNEDGTPFFGSPTKLFEYMAMGKGIVASRLDQIGEVLSPGLNAAALPTVKPKKQELQLAVLAAPGDLEQLVNGIRFLVEDREWREHLGKQARIEALAKYTWQHHVQAILDGLNSAVTKERGNAT